MSSVLYEMLIGEVSAPAAILPFKSTWRTTAANETITLPLTGGASSSHNSIVDWGDGTTSTITSSTDPNRIHTYATSGDYQVTVTGTMTGWAFNAAGDVAKIRSIDQWGILRFETSQAGHFRGCVNLQMNATDTPVLSASCFEMFRLCSAMTGNAAMNNWNTSGVTTMEGMFRNATAFNAAIGSWNTSSVTSFFQMFFSAQAFNQPIGSWNTSSAINMSGMFGNARSFNQPIGSWDVSKVTNFSNMFSQVPSANNMTFNQDIGAWNTGAALIMSGMFRNSVSFNCGQPSGVVHTLMQRTATGGWRIGGVTSVNLASMFDGASSFAGDISSWCADVATTLPVPFSTGAHANFTVALQPTWGACPIPD